ncbi:MAG: ParB/RepB/Spo0J family partition protein [Ferrovum sp.]|jgi:ParB family chromosome partitioning protein|uniref:ParB/RepB/Spo0J family partition protein n=1 Tax=Ferrovum sp. TaxID=2609467 RepID=UPI002620C776|nr:ParB/RepB/Spo0J family partition protein [Ferrovum sp.]MBW8067319.1 ParB/RepB/Spo0J family partition protein [Ferrovum sp.]
MKKNKGLGRGLDALLGEDRNGGEDLNKNDRLTFVAVNHLQPGKYQPRTKMDANSLDELAQSIKTQGLLQPILVRAVATGNYEIIAGERRWRASRMAGLTEVPVMIRDIPDETALAVGLIENIQRENLNPLEEAQGLERLIDEFGMTHEGAAQAVGRSRSAVTNLLRLLQLSENVQSLLMEGMIEMGHARAMVPLPEPLQKEVALEVVDKQLSVRQTEQRVKKLQTPTSAPRAPKVSERSRDILKLEESLADHFGTQVLLKAGSKGHGSVTIKFTNLEQLEGILMRFGLEKE